MSGNRQDLSGAPGETPTNIQDPDGMKEAAGAFESMLEDIGPQPSMEEQEQAALAKAEPEDISGLDELDRDPSDDEDSDEEEELEAGSEEGEVEEYDLDEQSDEGQDEPDEPLYTVKVQGEEREVPLSELRTGYMLQSDYTRKTQALAAERQNFEAEMEAVRVERQQYQQLLGNLEHQLKTGLEEEPDWAALAQRDPVGYTRKKAEWDQKQKVLEAANQERQRVMQAEQEDFQRRVQAYNQRQREELLAKKPELSNPEKAREFQQNLVSYAQNEYGLNPAEVAAFSDHRAIIILEKAMMFDQMQAKGSQVQKKVKRKANKVVKPGAAKGKGQVRSRSLRQARERLSQTGDVRDAAKVFENFV